METLEKFKSFKKKLPRCLSLFTYSSAAAQWRKAENPLMAVVPDRPSDVPGLHRSSATDSGMMGVMLLTGRGRKGSHVESLCQSSTTGVKGRDSDREGERDRTRDTDGIKGEVGVSQWGINRHLITSQQEPGLHGNAQRCRAGHSCLHMATFVTIGVM